MSTEGKEESNIAYLYSKEDSHMQRGAEVVMWSGVC